MEVWCDQETAMFLSQPLPSTRLPPHYYVTCDKATPSTMTNQAVMLCLMIGGQRQAVAVKEAPYSWFSLKHFSYRSESSRDSRVESSTSGEIFKNYI